jgi:hypothetical protein
VKRGAEIEFIGPDPLQAEDWNLHGDYLAENFPGWTFASGFFEHPLEP